MTTIQTSEFVESDEQNHEDGSPATAITGQRSRHEDQAVAGRGRLRRRRGADRHRTGPDGRDGRRVAAHGVERTGPFWADFHDRAGTFRTVARHHQRHRDCVVDGYRFRHARRVSTRSELAVFLPICRRLSTYLAAFHRSKGSTGPADPRAPNILGTHEIRLPVIQLGYPKTWVTGAARPGASAHPTAPARRSRLGLGPDPFWPDTSASWESTTVVLPSPCVLPPQPDMPPPPPLQYGGQTVSPAFDGGTRQWGFWYSGDWVPLFGSECQTSVSDDANGFHDSVATHP